MSSRFTVQTTFACSHLRTFALSVLSTWTIFSSIVILAFIVIYISAYMSPPSIILFYLLYSIYCHPKSLFLLIYCLWHITSSEQNLCHLYDYCFLLNSLFLLLVPFFFTKVYIVSLFLLFFLN